MKKYGILAIALMLSMAFTACKSTDMSNDPSGTMPTLVTTLPTVTTQPTEDNIPGTSFQPDDDGLIGETEGTTNTDPSAKMPMMP